MTATWRIIEGDCRDRLAELPASSAHTCVTSPPFFGLRDYGTATWEGGEVGCEHRPTSIHEGRNEDRPTMRDGVAATNAGQLRHWAKRQACETCGARKVDRQIGLEPTPDEFVAALVGVFREVRRVLRDDGTVWLNLGDSYAGGGGFSPDSPSNLNGSKQTTQGGAIKGTIKPQGDVKAKDLLGIPWLVAFALRADGWYLRSDIIWAKPNPMPESVTDRPTKAHEYLFLLSKGPRYFYDADAIREDATRAYDKPGGGDQRHVAQPGNDRRHDGLDSFAVIDGGRNKRSVWTVANADMMRLRDDLSEADRAYVLGELHARGLLGGT